MEIEQMRSEEQLVAQQRMDDQVTVEAATILIVEDDSDIQSSLQYLFNLEGYHTLTASSGITALDLLDHEDIDLVVLDVMLPDMSGYDLCQTLRHSAHGRIPVLMLTALAQQQHINQGLSSGADDYVKKPYAPEELLLRARRLLAQHLELQSSEQETIHLQEALNFVQRQLEASRNETAVEASLRHEFLHNVTTHIQALSGIAEATVRKLPPSPERDAVQQLKSRIRAAALVYEITEALQDDPVEIGGVLRTIASALKSIYRPWKRVQLNLGNGAIMLPLSIASPLSMIVNELITNCFKHAFPDNRFGKIDLHYAVADGRLVLDVVDDGAGFDVGQVSGGRGRATVIQLAQALEGVADWSSDSTGTRVHITIPLA